MCHFRREKRTRKSRKREEYFAAVRAGLDRNYGPMEKLFSVVIKRTLQIHGA